MIYISIITSVIALVVGLVAYLNYRINRENFRLALFEKRFAVFEETRQLLAKIGQDAAVDVSDMGDYLRGTADAKFLFDDSVVKFLDKIYAHMNKLRTTNAKLKAVGIGEQRDRIVDKADEALDELRQSLSKISKVFMPYLGFHVASGNSARPNSYKRIVAREWLYLLSLIAFGVVFTLLAHLIFIPKQVTHVAGTSGPNGKSDYARIGENLDSTEYSLFRLLDSKLAAKVSARDYLKDGNYRKDRLEAKRMRDSLYEVARVNWNVRRDDWFAYSNKLNTIEGLSYAALILPYPLFWFIRSIMWAYRQVRKPKSETL